MRLDWVLWVFFQRSRSACRACLAGFLLLANPAVSGEAPPLIVVTDYWPPFRIAGEGEKMHGLDFDLLAELERRTGLRFEVRRMPWSRGLAALENGSVDLMTGLAKTPEREHYIDYLEHPYFTCAPRFYGLLDVIGDITSYAQLGKYEIGFVRGSVYFEPFDSDTVLNKVGVASEKQLLEMLQLKRLQLVIGTDCQVDYELLSNPHLSGSIVKLAYQPPVRTDLFMGFSRKRSLHEQRQAIAQALERMLKEGWIDEAARRYRPGSQ